MKILVIEDEPTSLKLISLVLKSAGHDVILEKRGDDALKKILEDKPDLVVVDLALPGLDGLELTKAVRANPETRHIKIVAVTAFPVHYYKQSAMDAGCDGFITKPFNTRTLLQQVEAFANPSPA